MPTSKALRHTLALLLALLASIAWASPAQTVTATAPDTPRIGVITMGPGAIFWERFGHDAIVVEDPRSGTRTSYNFGFFDPDEPDFLSRFIAGQMRYRLVALPLQEDLAYYRQAGRGAKLQWLALTPAQARTLAQALAINARPENARYHYDYFTDNCATRVRDALDRTLDGALRRQLQGRSSGDTYRSEALRLAAPAPWMWLAFDIGLGPYADQPLSRWQQAFLPRRLADDLRKVNGTTGRPLIAAEETLLPQRLAPEPAERDWPVWPWLLTGVLLAGLVLATGDRHRRTLGALAGLLWLICGLVGLVLALGWALTEHQAMWANRNLLLFNPLCLLLLPAAWTLLRGRTPPRHTWGVLLSVAVLAALACLPLWLQVHPQRNGHWIALLLPLHAALARLWPRLSA